MLGSMRAPHSLLTALDAHRTAVFQKGVQSQHAGGAVTAESRADTLQPAAGLIVAVRMCYMVTGADPAER